MAAYSQGSAPMPDQGAPVDPSTDPNAGMLDPTAGPPPQVSTNPGAVAQLLQPYVMAALQDRQNLQQDQMSVLFQQMMQAGLVPPPAGPDPLAGASDAPMPMGA